MKFEQAEIENLIEFKMDYVKKKYGKEARALILEILSLERALKRKEEGRLIPLPLWSKYYDYPTVMGMRMKVFHEEENGFKEFGVVHRNGKRVFIDEQAYKRWEKEHS